VPRDELATAPAGPGHTPAGRRRSLATSERLDYTPACAGQILPACPKTGPSYHVAVVDMDQTATGNGDSDSVRDRLRGALRVAMKARDPIAVAALRSAVAAIDNAEAVDAPGPGAGQPALIGLGAAEVERRLTVAQMEDIVRAEAADRQVAARDYDRAGRPDQAERLRAEAGVLAQVIDGTGDPEVRTP
jgi:uncharacterized protein